MTDKGDEMKVEIEGTGRAFNPNEVSIDYDGGAGEEKSAENTEAVAAEHAGETPVEEAAEPGEGVVPASGGLENPGEMPEEGSVPVDEGDSGTTPGGAGDDDQAPEAQADEDSIFDKSTLVDYSEGGGPTLRQSEKPQFNPEVTQDPRRDEEIEGGVKASRTTGPLKSFTEPSAEGSALKQEPDLDADSDPTKYEIGGFTVEYKVDKNIYSVAIRDYFEDKETAMAAVNGENYLMPMPKGGFKLAKITSGAPILCKDERQLFHYNEDRWIRS